jgi:hypothetical protein
MSPLPASAKPPAATTNGKADGKREREQARRRAYADGFKDAVQALATHVPLTPKGFLGRVLGFINRELAYWCDKVNWTGGRLDEGPPAFNLKELARLRRAKKLAKERRARSKRGS